MTTDFHTRTGSTITAHSLQLPHYQACAPSVPDQHCECALPVLSAVMAILRLNRQLLAAAVSHRGPHSSSSNITAHSLHVLMAVARHAESMPPGGAEPSVQ